MSQLNKDEMFGNLKEFLKSKGITMQEGSYTRRIRKGCGILSDSINLSQRAFSRAKSAVDTKLEQLREVIRKQTAPKPPAATAQAGAADKKRRASKGAVGRTPGTKTKAAASKRRTGRK